MPSTQFDLYPEPPASDVLGKNLGELEQSSLGSETDPGNGVLSSSLAYEKGHILPQAMKVSGRRKIAIPHFNPQSVLCLARLSLFRAKTALGNGGAKGQVRRHKFPSLQSVCDFLGQSVVKSVVLHRTLLRLEYRFCMKEP